MKRSLRVVLMLMGTAAVSSVSAGFVRRSDCGPVRRPDGRIDDACRIRTGGFGTTTHRFQWPGGGG